MINITTYCPHASIQCKLVTYTASDYFYKQAIKFCSTGTLKHNT